MLSHWRTDLYKSDKIGKAPGKTLDLFDVNLFAIVSKYELKC